MWMAIIAAAWAGPDALEGTWHKGNARIEATAGVVKMLLDGSVLQQGRTRVEGGTRQVAMDGCGATLIASGPFLEVTLDGPECPLDLAGTYTRPDPAADSHCEGSTAAFHCTIAGKARRLEVCTTGAQLSYRYGAVGKVELALEDGKAAERALASGMQYTWAFTNDGYGYEVWVVESARGADNGAGVIVSKGDKEVARLTCAEGWVRTGE